jgi:predicted membrane-bound spermidine synthase
MRFLAYIIVFLEGGALLSYEIMAAKMYTPHIGATLYVWTSILTLTLIALALSYRFSHHFIEKKKWKILPLSLLISGIYIIGVVFSRNAILPLTYAMEIKSASLFTGLLLLLIPVFFMGLTSPLISSWLTDNQIDKSTDKAGNFAGFVYGIGTLSGVLFTLICLFVLMPVVGVNNTIILLGLMLILAGIVSYFFIKMAK